MARHRDRRIESRGTDLSARTYTLSLSFGYTRTPDMWTGRLLTRKSRLTSYGLGVILFCVVPFLFDVALCDEFAAAPLLEPTLMDGEKVVPSKATDHSLTPDSHIVGRFPHSEGSGEENPLLLAPRHLPRSFPLVVSLTSRPPPFSWSFRPIA